MRGFLTINHNNLIFFFKLFGVYKKALTFAAYLYEITNKRTIKIL